MTMGDIVPMPAKQCAAVAIGTAIADAIEKVLASYRLPEHLEKEAIAAGALEVFAARQNADPKRPGKWRPDATWQSAGFTIGQLTEAIGFTCDVLQGGRPAGLSPGSVIRGAEVPARRALGLADHPHAEDQA
jgi:hypothetical protein